MNNKKFDEWNIEKQKINIKKNIKWFQPRDIFWAKIGMNIGDEENGKGEFLMRPLLVIKKFNNSLFWGIPLSTKIKKNNKYYISFELKGKIRSAIISQIRLFDGKRLVSKIGKCNKERFSIIKKAVQQLLDD